MSDQLRIKQTQEFTSANSFSHGDSLTWDENNDSFVTTSPTIVNLAATPVNENNYNTWPTDSSAVLPQHTIFTYGEGLLFIVTNASGYNPDTSGDGIISTTDYIAWLAAAGGQDISYWPNANAEGGSGGASAPTRPYEYEASTDTNESVVNDGEFNIIQSGGVYFLRINNTAGNGVDTATVFDDIADTGGRLIFTTQIASAAGTTYSYIFETPGTVSGSVTYTSGSDKVYSFILDEEVNPNGLGAKTNTTNPTWSPSGGDGYYISSIQVFPDGPIGPVEPDKDDPGVVGPPTLGTYRLDTTTTTDPSTVGLPTGGMVMSTSNTSLSIGNTVTLWMSPTTADTVGINQSTLLEKLADNINTNGSASLSIQTRNGATAIVSVSDINTNGSGGSAKTPANASPGYGNYFQFICTVEALSPKFNSTFQNDATVFISYIPFGNAGAQGSVGNQGIQGVQGAQGNQGIQGAQGATGNQGVQGAQGNQGNQGIQGAQGDQGIQGVQGAQGDQGIKGAQGNQGIQGTQGNQGIQGAQGAQGATGNQGIQGAQGNQGIQGAQGNQGIQGVQGVQGAQGNQGIQGVQGAQGDQGIQGVQGAQGDQGIQGAQGNQGNQGVQGAQGNQGNQGIQGAQGDQGIQGVQGAQGNQGDQGIQGVQGAQGNQGNQGIQGAQGDQGIQGVQGAQGNQGIQGVQGAQGATRKPRHSRCTGCYWKPRCSRSSRRPRYSRSSRSSR